MRIIGNVAALAVFVALIATMPPPSAAQVVVDQKLDACGLSLSFLRQIRDGADMPKGVEIHPRLKAENGYKTDLEKQLYLFDGYREFGDVRVNCKPELWSDEIKPASLKAAVTAAAKAAPERFCAAGAEGAETPASLIPKWLADPEVTFFRDRALELNNQLPLSPEYIQLDRRLAESGWLREASQALVAACKPNDAVKPALAIADRAFKVATDNDLFSKCVKARDGYKPQMTAFDAAAQTQDPKAMKAAYAALETAAKPVKAACKPSEEGAKEVDYILASRKMQIGFVEIPGCRDAAKLMNDQRTAMNTTAKEDLPAAAAKLRQIAKDAKKACKNDPAPQVWGDFVAWITEKNMTRLP